MHKKDKEQFMTQEIKSNNGLETTLHNSTEQKDSKTTLHNAEVQVTTGSEDNPEEIEVPEHETSFSTARKFFENKDGSSIIRPKKYKKNANSNGTDRSIKTDVAKGVLELSDRLVSS